MIHKRAKGDIGENIACEFLEKHGFVIIDRNYQKKWGELDIVATKEGRSGQERIIHFFEVKSVVGSFLEKSLNVHKPEDNVDTWKVKHLRRMIETYLYEKGRGMETPFQFHILSVYMDMKNRRGRVKWLKDLIL